MAECPKIPECAFYHDRLHKMPMTAEFMKMVYCHQRAEECKRASKPELGPVSDIENAQLPTGVDRS